MTTKGTTAARRSAGGDVGILTLGGARVFDLTQVKNVGAALGTVVAQAADGDALVVGVEAEGREAREQLGRAGKGGVTVAFECGIPPGTAVVTLGGEHPRRVGMMVGFGDESGTFHLMLVGLGRRLVESGTFHEARKAPAPEAGPPRLLDLSADGLPQTSVFGCAVDAPPGGLLLVRDESSAAEACEICRLLGREDLLVAHSCEEAGSLAVLDGSLAKVVGRTVEDGFCLRAGGRFAARPRGGFSMVGWGRPFQKEELINLFVEDARAAFAGCRCGGCGRSVNLPLGSWLRAWTCDACGGRNAGGRVAASAQSPHDSPDSGPGAADIATARLIAGLVLEGRGGQDSVDGDRSPL